MESHLAILSKKSYDSCFKETSEFHKNKTISFILSNRIFNDLDQKKFKLSYFSLFFNEIVRKNHKILVQDQPNDFIYIIRNGDFEVSLKKSIMDINFIIKYYGHNPIKEKLVENNDCI